MDKSSPMSFGLFCTGCRHFDMDRAAPFDLAKVTHGVVALIQGARMP